MGDWITFPDGRRGRLSWAQDTERAAYWQTLLAAVHGDPQARPQCDCRVGGRPLALSVRALGRQGRGPLRYCLARMPGEGALHDASCPFHENDPRRSGRSGYEDGVIRELPDGRLRITLEQGLAVRERATTPSVPRDGEPGRQGGGQPRQASMRLLGLLHLLWEEGGLTTWSRSDVRRRAWWPAVRAALEQAATGLVAGRATLADHLATIGYRDPDGPALLAETVQACGEAQRVLLLGVVDRLERYRPASAGEDGAPPPPERLRLVFDGVRAYGLFVSGTEALAARLERSFPWAWRVLQQPRRERAVRVVALVLARVRQVERDGQTVRLAWADGIALMEVGPSLIPVASSHELAVLRALQEEERYFRKPLRYDAGRDVVHPDFELLDTGAPRGTPMEVFGRDDEAYAARREEKARHYTSVYGVEGWWFWDATRDAIWPPFPPAIAQKGESS